MGAGAGASGGASGGGAAAGGASGGASAAGNSGHAAAASGAASSGTAGAGAGTSAGTNNGHSGAVYCPAGYVLKSGSCVRITAGVLPDEELYRQGRALAVAGHYAEALPVLQAIQRTDDAMVYTMRGYALRQMGALPAAKAEYQLALAIDPENVNTHEYLGEWYVLQGRTDLARLELVHVSRKNCGAGCEQYDDLERAIETGRVE
jgi:tetratricopeptide (TPR) repeat protein